MIKQKKARSESTEALIEPGTKNIDQFISQIKEEINQSESQEIIEISLDEEPGQRIYSTIRPESKGGKR